MFDLYDAMRAYFTILSDRTDSWLHSDEYCPGSTRIASAADEDSAGPRFAARYRELPQRKSRE